MTNEEYIKSMTAEELAEWLAEHVDCIGCHVRTGCKAADNEECRKRFIRWLRIQHRRKKNDVRET